MSKREHLAKYRWKEVIKGGIKICLACESEIATEPNG